MQSNPSMTSKILSLGVHDKKSFEVDIALHPDLFSGTPGILGRHSRSGRNVHGRDSVHSSNTAVVSPQSPLVTNNAGASYPMSTYQPNEFSPKSSLLTPAHNNDFDLFPYQSYDTLKAGDVIEVRVWDENENRSSLLKGSQTSHRSDSTDIPTEYINTNLNYPSSLEEGKAMMNEPREKQQLNQTYYQSQSEKVRLQAGKLSSTSAKPPIAPRGKNMTSSIAASPNPLTAHSYKSHLSPNNAGRITSLGLNHVQPSKQAPNNNIKESQEFTSTPSSNPVRLSFSSSLREEGGIPPSRLPGPSKISKTITMKNEEAAKSESVNSEMFSLDNTRSNAIVGTIQSTNEQISSQRAPDMLDIISKTHDLRLKIIMVVTEKSLTTLKSTSRTQVSISKQVAELYGLTPYETKVTITKVHKSEEAAILDSVQADFVTVTIKDQFISRREIYEFSLFFVGKWIYDGQRLETEDGSRGNVIEIRNKISARPVKSGHITKDTKITFRSCSARIIWLVQISSEMWDYTPPYLAARSQGESIGDKGCEIYFDRFVSFMIRLFDQWKELKVTHSLTVVFFSRTFISSKKRGNNSDTSKQEHSSHESTIQKDAADGRIYEDHFKVVVEDNTEQASDWHSLVLKIKKAFVSYPSEVGWDLSSDSRRIPSTATQGNILEAINTALNMLQLHYMDRDPCRTGNSVVVVSAGSGVFEVKKRLAKITKQRMIDNGIGSDMLSLGLPPLHVAPFFLYKEDNKPTLSQASGVDDSKKFFYEIPYWMHLSFISYDKIGRTVETSVEKTAEDCSMKIEKQDHAPQIHVLSNSFLIRNQVTQNAHMMAHNAQQSSSNISKQSRHLISERDFEDILEACRPRNRGGSSASELPSALLHRLKIIDQIESKSVRTGLTTENELKEDVHQIRGNPKSSKFTTKVEEDKFPVREWGSVVFDEVPGINAVRKTIPTISERVPYGRKPMRKSHDQVVAASLNSDSTRGGFSPLLGHSPSSIHSTATPTSNGLQIQQSSSIDMMPMFTIGNSAIPLKKTSSNDSISTMGTDDNPSSLKTYDFGSCLLTRKMPSIESLRNAMVNHDKKVFCIMPKDSKDQQKGNIFVGISTEESNVATEPSFGSAHQPGGGIEAELTRFNHWQSKKSSSCIPQQKRGPVPFHRQKSVTVKLLSRPDQTKTYGRSPDKEVTVLGQKYDRSKYTKKDQHPPERSTFQSSREKSKLFQSKTWVFNPFRQEDEEKVLAKRTLNSRRWSHVFPKGETEYKRHAGPNWKSLCQPAILPVIIDIDINPKKLNERSIYTLDHYSIILNALDVTRSHSDLLNEMVKQRLIQDFQLVYDTQSEIVRNDSCVQRNLIPTPESGGRRMQVSHSQHKSATAPEKCTIQHTLSMGNRVQVLTYNPTSDSIKVEMHTKITKKSNPEINAAPDYRYKYKLWSKFSSSYGQMSQNFLHYPGPYPWNMIDTLISGEREKTLAERTRHRRISYRIIPDKFNDQAGEEEFIKKMRNLIDFLDKITKQKGTLQNCIQIISKTNQQHDTKLKEKDKKRIIVPIGKKNEWMEIVIDPTVDTRRTFRVMFHWLVASAIQVEKEKERIVRNCKRYGLSLVQFPHISLSSSMHIHPFLRPEIIPVNNPKQAETVEAALINMFDFVEDVKPLIYPEHVNVAFGLDPKYGKWNKMVPAQQYVHRSGTNFIRLLKKFDSTLFVFYENRKHTNTNPELSEVARNVLSKLYQFVHSVQS